MSLDDESPTQYFGPDAKLWKHPQTGHTLYLSPAQYERAEKRRLENEALAGKGKLLIPQADGSYAEFDLNDPKPALAPARLGHKYQCMDEYYPETCCCDNDAVTDTICCHKGYGWHRDDQVGCEHWEVLVEHSRRRGDGEVIRNGYGHSDTDHPKFDLEEALKQAPPTSHPASRPESQSFAEAVSKRYQESLWGKAPTAITVNLGTVEERLEQKRTLHRLRAKSERKDLLSFLPAPILQLLIAIFVTAASASLWAVMFCWAIVALEAAWTTRLYRSWRRAVKQCKDLK
ncbi:membrane protein [Arthrobacter phage Beagle]|nr:membrane protein [Arthrobacter phage Beagle]